MKHWRHWATAVVLLAFAAAAFAHRQELSEAVRQIGTLSLRWIAVLLIVVVVGIIAQGAFATSVTPGLTLGQGISVQQATTAANNTIIGSGPVSTGLRIAMLRSWKVSDPTIGLTIVALNLVAEYTVWIVALAVSLIGALRPNDGVIHPRIYGVVILVAVVVLLASTVLWWLLLSRPTSSRWLAMRAQRLWNAVRRRFRRLPDLNLIELAEQSRQGAHRLVHRRGARIVMCSMIDQSISILKPVAVVRAFGISSTELTTANILIAYGLIRLAVALTPIPGGLGITEFGLATLLTRFGGPSTTVLAAVLTYRAMTFVLPFFTGAVCLTIWRWSLRSQTSEASNRADENATNLATTDL